MDESTTSVIMSSFKVKLFKGPRNTDKWGTYFRHMYSYYAREQIKEYDSGDSTAWLFPSLLLAQTSNPLSPSMESADKE